MSDNHDCKGTDGSSSEDVNLPFDFDVENFIRNIPDLDNYEYLDEDEDKLDWNEDIHQTYDRNSYHHLHNDDSSESDDGIDPDFVDDGDDYDDDAAMEDCTPIGEDDIEVINTPVNTERHCRSRREPIRFQGSAFISGRYDSYDHSYYHMGD